MIKNQQISLNFREELPSLKARQGDRECTDQTQLIYFFFVDKQN